MADFDLFTLLFCGIALLLGGLVKGIAGIGLPLVAVPLLSSVIPVPEAIALMAVPLLASNLWQTFHGGRFLAAFRRFWPMIVALWGGIALGTRLLVASDPRTLQLALGLLVIATPLTSHFQPKLMFSTRHERWLGMIIGFTAGVIGGFSSFFGPPIILYLVALRLSKEEFIVSVSMLFCGGIVPLYAVLVAHGVLDLHGLVLSSLATGPAFAGLLIGQRLRAGIDQDRFRRTLLVLLLLIGLNLVRKGLGWP